MIERRSITEHLSDLVPAQCIIEDHRAYSPNPQSPNEVIHITEAEQGITLKPDLSKGAVIDLVRHVADNGGEISFKTVKGKVQDVHITPAEQQSHNPMRVGYVPPKGTQT